MDISTKKEIIFNSYERSLDWDIALLRADLTPDELVEVENDEVLRMRIALKNAEIQEELITNMRELAKSEIDSIRLNATLRLGRMIYANRFNVENITKHRGDREEPFKVEYIFVDPDKTDDFATDESDFDESIVTDDNDE